MFVRISLLAISLLTINATADENGKIIGGPVACQGSVFSSIQKVCSLIDKTGAKCKITSDSCVQASQELFTGNLIELASATNIKPWNGLGGAMADGYAKTTNCLLRDLADLPEQKITTQASASTLFGDVHAKQEVGFLSFNKDTATFEGYHRLQACGPVVGCIDAYTQKFRLTPVQSDKKSSGLNAGAYQIQTAYGLDLWAEGLAQGIQVSLPGLTVVTPYGAIDASPEFRFARATGFNGAPFDGNFKSSLPDPGLGIPANHMVDVYGRNPGTQATAVSPMDILPDTTPVYSPKGWISQMGLGSRDPNPASTTWKPAAGVEFPSRPDLDIKTARSNTEKMPNAYLGASIMVSYSPINLIPQVIRDIGCSGIVQVCINQLQVWAKPGLDVGFSSQFNVFENEQMNWNGTMLGGATIKPIPDFRPWNWDQTKGVALYAGSAAASRFALEAGLDLNIHLSIDTFFTSIDKDLVDVHPKTTIASSVSKGFSPMKTANARTQVTKLFADKKFFQQYVTFKGVDEAATPGVDGGEKHIQACLAKPSATGSMPPEPTYTPGNTSVLIDEIEYPCNICLNWDPIDYKDNAGKAQQVPGMHQTLFPASEAGKPAGVQWACKIPFQNGCHDMCKMDKTTGKLTVVYTALELLAAGVTNMPSTCARGRP